MADRPDDGRQCRHRRADAASPPLGEPTKAWRLLQDREVFPRLAALLDHAAFPIDTFRTSYKRAKGCLEVRAGFRDRSIVDVIDSAGRFSDRARKFVARHADLPDEAGKRVLARVGDVKRACDKADRDAIEKGTIELSKAAADAISAVYVVSERSATAAEDRTAAARKMEGHPGHLTTVAGNGGGAEICQRPSNGTVEKHSNLPAGCAPSGGGGSVAAVSGSPLGGGTGYERRTRDVRGDVLLGVALQASLMTECFAGRAGDAEGRVGMSKLVSASHVSEHAADSDFGLRSRWTIFVTALT